MMTANMIYRGPLQRSRLSFLAASAARAYGPVKLFWIMPRRITKHRVEHFQRFIEQNLSFADWELVDGRTTAAPVVRPYLRRLVEQPAAPTLAVGFTALPYASAVAQGKLIWCINGIPEERGLRADTLSNWLVAKALWQTVRLWRTPDLVVTVSKPMAALVKQRGSYQQIFTAPNGANLDIFTPQTDLPRPYMTYMGTDAPWQGLEQLTEVWGALYRQDPTVRFRVISREQGSRILGSKLPSETIEFCAVEDPQAVARLLWEAEAGCLIREPHLVNRVSFPLKFAEYLAAGAYVITTDLGWDPGDIVKQTGCGVLLSAGQRPEEMARAILGFRSQIGRDNLARNCQNATAMLDRQAWIERLAARLP